MPRSRRRLLTSAVVLAAAIAGCTPAAKPYAAATTPPPPDPVLQKAQVECADLAARATETVTPQGQASKAAIGIYYKCMTEKGYPPHPHGGAPHPAAQ